MDYSGFQLIGAFILLVMIILFYRSSILEVLKTPKESLILCIPIILLGIMFYFFLKLKVFKADNWRPQGDSNPCCRRERAVS